MTGKYRRKGWSVREARGDETSWQRGRKEDSDRKQTKWVWEGRGQQQQRIKGKLQREPGDPICKASITFFSTLSIMIYILILSFRNLRQGPKLQKHIQYACSLCNNKSSPPDCFMLSKAAALTTAYVTPIVFIPPHRPGPNNTDLTPPLSRLFHSLLIRQ